MNTYQLIRNDYVAVMMAPDYIMMVQSSTPDSQKYVPSHKKVFTDKHDVSDEFVLSNLGLLW